MIALDMIDDYPDSSIHYFKEAIVLGNKATSNFFWEIPMLTLQQLKRNGVIMTMLLS